MQGVRLQVDRGCSIWATRLGMNSIIVQDHNQPDNVCVSDNVIKCRGELTQNQPIKVSAKILSYSFYKLEIMWVWREFLHAHISFILCDDNILQQLID